MTTHQLQEQIERLQAELDEAIEGQQRIHRLYMESRRYAFQDAANAVYNISAEAASVIRALE